MNQSNLQLTISALFPLALMLRDYTVAVDSSGNATITLWNNALGVEPTTAQLTAQLTALQLQQAQAAQTSIIAQASAVAQTTGFSSSALGSAYSYPSGLQDQSNLCACCTYSLFPGNPTTWTVEFWCTSATGVSSFMPHTAAQIQQVGVDAQAAIMVQKSKQNTLTQQINAATTIAAVQAVVWS